MNTLVQIAEAVFEYISQLKQYKEQTNNSIDDIENIQKRFLVSLKSFRELYPELAQYRLWGEPENGIGIDVDSAIDTISNNAKSRLSIPCIPIQPFFDDIVQVTKKIEDASHIVTPQYESMKNMLLSFSQENQKLAFDSLFNMLHTYILTIPIGKLQFRIVDISLSLQCDHFISSYPKQIGGGCAIREEKELNQFIDTQLKRIDNYKKKGKTFDQINAENETISMPYQVLVLTDPVNNYQRYGVKIRTLIEQGKDAGTYLIVMNVNNPEQEITGYTGSTFFNDICKAEIKQNPIKTGLVYPSPIWNNDMLREASIEYVQKAINKEDLQTAVDYNAVAVQDYCSADEKIEVRVANDANFLMNTIDHTHAFIIGQSGSGKSVFLHNIVGSIILKYAPEDLQLYLLDFKLGGVEFNRYKGVKHVKAMLVDNSDQQITLEILRDLKGQMENRGKQLRDAGVSNIMEYNEANQEKRMPHIMVVADECHELFRVGNDIPRAVSSEISEIVTKIAKEGRSQGVHLVFATQTLSGTEISNEILNNISDHYLLKCSQMDSERMVPGSSDITSGLSTGQIYYHHVDEQTQFQAYYTKKEEAQQLVKSAIEKAKDNQSNGEFYFSGSQLFGLQEDILVENKKLKKYPVAFAGKSIDLKQKDVSITLKDDYSENILVFGLNDEEQVTRTTMNLMTSMMMAAKKGGLELPITVINCLNNEDSPYESLLDDLEDAELCTIVNGKKRGAFLQKLAEDIKDNKAESQVLFILGQDKFRELKLDMELESKASESSADDDFASMLGGFSSDNGTDVKTYRKALELILDRGPEVGVHTIIQIEKPTNLLFEDLTAKEVFQKFKHLIMLKSDEMAASRLNLRDNIRLETLSKDAERLRAYYYAEEKDEYTLFTPYIIGEGTNIVKLIETIE